MSRGAAPLVGRARFTTDGFDGEEQLNAWRERLGPHFGMADVDAVRSSATFRASMESVIVGTLALTEILSDAMTFERKRAHAERRHRDEFTVGVLVDGVATAEQDGRRARIGAGEMIVCDNRRPFRLVFDRPFKQIIFHCDRVQLEARVPDASHRTATRLRAPKVLAATASYVATLGGESALSGREAAAVAQHALDLVSFAIVGTSPGADTSTTMLGRVYAYVEENLADVTLAPETIARRFKISRRQLYRMFDETGDSVAAFIRSRRLLRARAMLADQRHERRTVAEIAFATGFNDASSFARAFRDEFHVAPREYRVACADPGERSAPRP